MQIWLVLHEWQGVQALSMWVLAVQSLRTEASLPGSDWYRQEGAGLGPRVLLDIHLARKGFGRAGEPASISYSVAPDVARLEGGPPETAWAILLYRSPGGTEGRDGPPPRYPQPLDSQGGSR